VLKNVKGSNIKTATDIFMYGTPKKAKKTKIKKVKKK
tara:strand:+ start:4385 stop:4495 length:111 start_codon:yes stop_codon:yes gene_type:complete